MKIALALCCSLFLALGAPAETGETTVLRGRVAAPDSASGEPLQVHVSSGEIIPLALEEDRRLTLLDPELADREWEFAGSFTTAGALEVRRMFTIKDGQRHEITYYCEICHITSYRPGRCMCCQLDVELRETPVDD